MKAGVIGVGVHGLHHVRLLSRMRDTKLVGIHDADAGTGNAVAGQFGIRSYGNIQDLLDDVDCVTVATTTSAHHAVVMECLERGRPVLVEKPISSTTEEAEEMIDLAAKKGLVLAVGHLERFNPAYRALEGEGIVPKFIESHRLSVFNPRGTDVAVVLDLMIHDIDIVLDLVKRPVAAVHAAGVSVVTDEADIANARIEFEGGCVANLTASRISQRKMRKVRIFQRNAYISMDCLEGETEVFSLDTSGRIEPLPHEPPQAMQGISYRKIKNDGKNALELELEDFMTAISRGTRPRVDGRDGLNALEVASMVMESMSAALRAME